MAAIKYFHASNNDAPQLSGQNGTLIAVLDAVLVNGYGQVSVSSITRVSSVATVTTSAPHQLRSGDSALIAGAEQAEYNGDFVVSATGDSTFTFAVTGAPATPATGTITCKRAPAGFSKVFSASNKAVYRSNDVTGLRHYIQVIDDGSTTGGAKEAKVRGYVTMTDVDTGTEPFPTVEQTAIGLLSYKSSTINSTARPWRLISDGKTFYFSSAVDQAPISMMENGGWIWHTAFGDLIPTRPGDAYCSFIAANNLQNTQTSTGGQNGMFFTPSRSYSAVSASASMPRDWSNSIGAVWAAPIGHGWDEAAAGVLALFSYPHQQDNGFYMTPFMMSQRGVLRGRFPGVFEPLQGVCLNNYGIVENIDGYPGRKFMAWWGRYYNTTGMLMLDTTGPWS